MICDYKGISPQIDSTCFLAPGSMVIGDVTLGRHSGVWFNAVLRGDISKITVGENTNIQDGCIVHCVHHIPVTIGNYVTVGHGAILHSCSIDDYSLIGMGAIVLDGVKIGKHCLIGAGALVPQNKIIPDYSLVIGSPAKVIRQLTEEEIEHVKRGAYVYTELISEY